MDSSNKHFHRELDRIKKMILSLGAMAEDRVRMAIKSIQSRNVDIASRIVNTDYEIDEIEVEIEEECLKTLALYQPVAVDLRFIVAVIKINNDLERIADEAVNIALRVENISKSPHDLVYFDFTEMAEKAEAMLKKSLDAIINLDSKLAVRVCSLDDEVDTLHRNLHDAVNDAIIKNPHHVDFLISHLLISRHLERIADHATNIAEEVIYLVEGEIVRHGNFEKKYKIYR